MAGYTRTVAPTSEPLTTAQAKAHLNVDHTAFDTQIESLIKSARRSCEAYLGRALITQTWKLYLDCFPSDGCAIRLPNPPLQSVTSITYIDQDGATQTWASGNYQVDTVSTVGRIILAPGEAYPSTESGRINAVTITYVCGYGDASTAIPENILHAVRLTVGDFFTLREDTIIGNVANDIPNGAKRLLTQERVYTFF